MIAYVLPTLNRPRELATTLNAIGMLPAHDAEVIVVDNGSEPRALRPLQQTLTNGVGVRVIELGENRGTAARNEGVRAADRSAKWIVMLDDDSHPVGLGHLRAIENAGEDVAAVQAEITLGGQGAAREAGGLPEVFIGCGVAIRREAFVEAGGYDASFGYYAEEYDLAAKMLLGGWRVTMDRRFRVVHRKAQTGRDMDTILHRLVRNNGWVAQRYAPESVRQRELREVIDRYRRIAVKEEAERGYEVGLAELERTLGAQLRREMSEKLWDRFTGKASTRRSLLRAFADEPFATAALVDSGKNDRVIAEALEEIGVELVAEERAEALVIGTLSPGPMLDAWERRVKGSTERAEPRSVARARADVRVIAAWADICDAPRGAAAPARRASLLRKSA